MNPLNPLYALVIFLITFSTGYLINKKYKFKPASNRFETIDGLRGFLAISVFICHSTVWYKYLHTGNWTVPDSSFYTQLGQTGVVFFFMISGFLFINKLIVFKGSSYDWKSFFVKRFFRLAPLHFFIVLIIILIVFIQSDWSFNTSYLSFAKSTIKWFGFGVIGLPYINNTNAAIINSGVLWSLSDEWLFYFSLPLISLIILKSKPSIFFIILSLAFIAMTHHFLSIQLENVLSFAGGAIAPLIIKYNKKKINFNNLWFSLIVVTSMIGIVQFDTSANYICKLLTAICFTLIALGNNIFGLLKNTIFKFLGEISYSTYLLHGIMIFIVINYVFGVNEAKLLSQTQYCILMFTISPLVILISFVTYRFIEEPYLEKAKHYFNAQHKKY